MGSLTGKSAIVTGSTSGIGKGIAETLARAGANILLNGFGDPAEIEKQRAALAASAKVDVVYHNADMSKPAEIRDMVATAEKKFGRVDILVNNAGIQHVAAVEHFPEDKWDAIIAINLSSAFHATKAALPGMRAAKWGRVINIASTHGLVASAEKSAYVAAKHGIVGLTKTVALETAGSGVTCVAICPGWVLTPLVQKQIDAKAAAQGISGEAARAELLREKQPSGDFATPEQIGETVLFLCSAAATQITGSTIALDGGWLAQ
ncbi:MAG TPA: 3-hydroxybutyrate dehydrogenase [Dongiaceae bacterium]|nr:3-hydroxybutyrate dehydrogenase [Dongiaceae bacterium]